MEASPSSVELVEIVRIRATYTREFFEALGLRSFPQTYLHDVASLPIRLVDFVLAAIEATPPPVEDEVSTEAFKRQIKRYGFLLEHVHRVAEFLESSEVLAIPASMTLFLADTVTRLVPDARIVLRADTEFNYSFDPLAESINEPLDASGLKDLLPTPLGVFKFPSACRDDALLHAILAHEVGHFLDQVHNQSQQAFDGVGMMTNAEIESEISSSLNGSLSDVDAAFNLLYYWLGEVLSDLCGVHVLGPAFALAMREFFAFENDPTQGETHPPTLIRLKIIEEELKHLGWEDLLVPLWQPVPDYDPPADITGSTAEERIIATISQHIAKYADSCREVTRSFFADNSLTPGKFSHQHDEMRELLASHLPPAESMHNGVATSFSPESIVNACWMFWASGAEPWKDANYTSYEKRALIGRLMLKALEISRIRVRLNS